MTAATLLAGALAGGADGLSQRDCLLCLAYLYSGGNTATAQLAAAISSGCDKLSDGDIEKCLAELLNSASSNSNVTPDAPIITAGSLSGSTVSITWTAASNPEMDFIFYWGTAALGPFPNSQSLSSDLRTASFDSGSIFLGNVYGVIVARNAINFVSPNSNIFTFPLVG